MEKTYNKKQRKAIYLKLAQEFESGKQRNGLCYAFRNYCEESYDPQYLLKQFPELRILWFKQLSLIPERADYSGFENYNEEVNYNYEKRRFFRATLLYFAYHITE